MSQSSYNGSQGMRLQGTPPATPPRPRRHGAGDDAKVTASPFANLKLLSQLASPPREDRQGVSQSRSKSNKVMRTLSLLAKQELQGSPRPACASSAALWPQTPVSTTGTPATTTAAAHSTAAAAAAEGSPAATASATNTDAERRRTSMGKATFQQPSAMATPFQQHAGDQSGGGRAGAGAGGRRNSGASTANSGRKGNTLMSITTQFCDICCGFKDCEIALDTIAEKLGVGRRRIYDVVNVFEGLELVMRKGKNTYIWKGFDNMNGTLAKLKALSTSHLESPKRSARTTDGSEKENKNQRSPSLDADGTKKERSLGVLAQRFIMLFMRAEGAMVSMDEAAETLIFGPGCPEEKRSKTKIRRLYDISNILMSLELIEKVNSPPSRNDNKRAVFRWCNVDLSVLEAPSVSKVKVRTRTETNRRNQKQSLFHPDSPQREEAPEPAKRAKRTSFAASHSHGRQVDQAATSTITAADATADAVAAEAGGTPPPQQRRTSTLQSPAPLLSLATAPQTTLPFRFAPEVVTAMQQRQQQLQQQLQQQQGMGGGLSVSAATTTTAAVDASVENAVSIHSECGDSIAGVVPLTPGSDLSSLRTPAHARRPSHYTGSTGRSTMSDAAATDARPDRPPSTAHFSSTTLSSLMTPPMALAGSASSMSSTRLSSSMVTSTPNTFLARYAPLQSASHQHRGLHSPPFGSPSSRYSMRSEETPLNSTTLYTAHAHSSGGSGGEVPLISLPKRTQHYQQRHHEQHQHQHQHQQLQDSGLGSTIIASSSPQEAVGRQQSRHGRGSRRGHLSPYPITDHIQKALGYSPSSQHKFLGPSTAQSQIPSSSSTVQQAALHAGETQVSVAMRHSKPLQGLVFSPLSLPPKKATDTTSQQHRQQQRQQLCPQQ